MVNLKDYRDKELRYYFIANITVLLLLLDFFHISQSENNMQIPELISNFLNISILSSTIYVLAFIADSLFSANIKKLLIVGHLPGEKIFSRIQKATIDKRFSHEDALKKYSEIYKSLPTVKKDRYDYENTEWYKIYNKHREITMIMVSNRDFLLCRDIYFSTIVMIIIYFFLTIVFKIIIFDCRYLGYLIVMLILSNIGTRNKAMRFTCNVIAYDIANDTTYNIKENNHG